MKKSQKLLLASSLIGGAWFAHKVVQGKKEIESNMLQKQSQLSRRFYGDRQAYFIGDGLDSLSGAMFLINDALFPAENIHFYPDTVPLEPLNYGSNKEGFSISHPYSIFEEYSPNFWDLMSLVPSKRHVGWTQKDELILYGKSHPRLNGARLIDSSGQLVDIYSLGLNANDRASFFGIFTTPEILVEKISLNEWFGPHFFETNFWRLWQISFNMQKWSSLVVFKRQLHRMFDLIVDPSPDAILYTPYDRTESIILPLKETLQEKGAHFHHRPATNLVLSDSTPRSVSAILLDNDTHVPLKRNDLCFISTNSLVGLSAKGDFVSSPAIDSLSNAPESIWKKTSQLSLNVGNPNVFFRNSVETGTTTFTITLKDDALLRQLETFSGNTRGSDGLITFQDSRWLLSLFIPPEPYFKNQGEKTHLLWGYGLSPTLMGDSISKPLVECTGEEILEELFFHLSFTEEQKEEIREHVINVIPTYFPFSKAAETPTSAQNRPHIRPRGTENLALLGSFVNLPIEIPTADEYSVYGARVAVHSLLNLEPLPLPKLHVRNPKLLVKMLRTAYY